ncbi:WS/DGAT domain-containing protein [Mycobacterium sp. BMJ-28]
MFWMSAKIPNDTFLVFGFDGVPADLERALDDLVMRARTSPDLSQCIDDSSWLHYPRWAPCPADRSRFLVHAPGEGNWAGCLSAVGTLVDDQLDPRVTPWRLHIFTGIDGIPGVDGPGTVAALQITHALGGGGRTCAPAALMFGRPGTVPAVVPPSTGPLALPWRSVQAARAYRELHRDTESGALPPPAPGREPLRTNAAPAGVRAMRTLVRPRASLSGGTVTVVALAGISAALAGQLAELGESTAALGAEVTMGKAGARRAYNHFGTVGVGLHPELPVADRIPVIAAELEARRQRAAHPAMRASEQAFAATPAPLLRWGIDQFDPAVRSPTVTGNTVVSSVNCGAADFGFGGAPVRVAAAFPGLSPMVGLTHCVTGVGDTVSISVFAAESAIGDVDAYMGRLESAFGGV